MLARLGPVDHRLLGGVEEIAARNFEPCRPLTLMMASRTSFGRLSHLALLVHSEKYAEASGTMV